MEGGTGRDWAVIQVVNGKIHKGGGHRSCLCSIFISIHVVVFVPIVYVFIYIE